MAAQKLSEAKINIEYCYSATPEDAKKGLVDAPATLTIKNDKGDVIGEGLYTHLVIDPTATTAPN